MPALNLKSEVIFWRYSDVKQHDCMRFLCSARQMTLSVGSNSNIIDLFKQRKSALQAMESALQAGSISNAQQSLAVVKLGHPGHPIPRRRFVGNVGRQVRYFGQQSLPGDAEIRPHKSRQFRFLRRP
jgi:hypothetical protein